MAWGEFTVLASLKKILAAFNLKFNLKVAGEGHCTLQVQETLFKKKRKKKPGLVRNETSSSVGLRKHGTGSKQVSWGKREKNN